MLAEHNDCRGVAWTYNEPTIWLEYILDGAQVAHEHGLYTVMVTNGYITDEALDVLAPHIDAYRVDVKGFSDEAYYELCRIKRLRAGAARGRARQARARLPRRDRHQRDPDAQRRRRRRCAASPTGSSSELGPKTPWHVTRFMPVPRVAHLPATPIRTLERAVDDRPRRRPAFVYVGNVPGHAGENTVCPNCKRLLVRRTGYEIEDVALRGTSVGCAERT